MADLTVSTLAKNVGIGVDILLQKLKQAGLPQTKAEDAISAEQQQALLGFIRGGGVATAAAPTTAAHKEAQQKDAAARAKQKEYADKHRRATNRQ